MIPRETVLENLRRTQALARRFEEGYRDDRSLSELKRLSRSWDTLDRLAEDDGALHLVLGDWAKALMRAEAAAARARKES